MILKPIMGKTTLIQWLRYMKLNPDLLVVCDGTMTIHCRERMIELSITGYLKKKQRKHK